MTTHNGTPAKLRSGAWGARIPDSGRAVRQGDRVSITARSGKSWSATVERVVWQGDGATLVATQSEDRPRRGRLVGYHTEAHCSCGNWSGPNSPCLYSYGEAKDEGEARYIRWEDE